MMLKKRVRLITIIFVLTGILTGCSIGDLGQSDSDSTNAVPENVIGSGTDPSDAAKETEEDSIEKAAKDLYENTFPVFIGISYKENLIFNKDKELSLYIDGEKIESLKQGEVSGYALILSQGYHTIAVSNNILNADLKTFKVEEDKVLGKEAANVFLVGIAYKNGSATITDLIGTNIYEYSSAEAAKYEYLERLLVITENYVPVNEFTAVLKRYGELNPQKGETSFLLDDNNGQELYGTENETGDNDTSGDGSLNDLDGGNTDDADYDRDEADDTYADHILPKSSQEYLSESDLKVLSAEECRIARNEIYARHGRRFDDTSLQAYFNGCSWYEGVIDPKDFSEDVLNEVEKANLQMIVAYEEKMGYGFESDESEKNIYEDEKYDEYDSSEDDIYEDEEYDKYDSSKDDIYEDEEYDESEDDNDYE